MFGFICNCFKLCVLISVAAITVKAEDSLQHTNSTSHDRFKRDQIVQDVGTHISLSHTEQSYYTPNQADAFRGYNYEKPKTNFGGVNGPYIPNDLREQYESNVNGQSFNQDQAPVPIFYYNDGQSVRELYGTDALVAQRLQSYAPNGDFSQRGYLSPQTVEERLVSRTMGDEQGAFINSDIFGTDFGDQNFTISPTGLFIPKPTGGTGFSSVAVSCDVPYQKPRMPDFRAANRRVSEVKCYEYIWELRTRAEKESRDKRCNNMRSKRSSQQYWLPASLYQMKTQQSGSFQESWSQQNGWHQDWYNPSFQQYGPPQSSYYPRNLTNMTDNNTNKNTESGTGTSFGLGFTDVEPEEFPHMAAIGWRGVNEPYVFKCGGSLISRNFVLTAAHCTASGPDPSITDIIPRIVRIGDINIGFRADGQTFTRKRSRRQARDPGRLDVNIINIMRHEQYNPNMRYFDIALFQLEYSLEFNKHLQPACLWTDPNSSSRIRKAVATGWGIVNLVTRSTTLNLQAGELDIVDTPTCNRLLQPSFGSKISQVVDHQICAGKLEGGTDVCQGDSGGPLQVKIQLPIKSQGSMHTILGIISIGVGCARPDTPGVYTRITSFLDWIERYVWP